MTHRVLSLDISSSHAEFCLPICEVGWHCYRLSRRSAFKNIYNYPFLRAEITDSIPILDVFKQFVMLNHQLAYIYVDLIWMYCSPHTNICPAADSTYFQVVFLNIYYHFLFSIHFIFQLFEQLIPSSAR